MRLWPRKQVYVDDLPRTHDLRFAAVFVLIFAFLLGGVYAVGFFVAGNRLPSGTSIAGIDVGGMRRGEARSVLQDKLIPRLDEPITASALGKTFTVDAQRAGLTFDIEATLSAGLVGDRWDPRHMYRVVMGGEPLPPVVDVDQRELDGAIARIAKHLERPAVDASVSFTGGVPTFTGGEAGVALNHDASGDRLLGALVSGDREIALPVVAVEPEITITEADTFVTEVATPAVTGNVRIRVADSVLTLRPRDFVPALRTRVDKGGLALAINPQILLTRSRDVIASLPHQPVHARIVFRNGNPSVVPSRSGVTVTGEDWAKAVRRAVARKAGRRQAVAKATADEPAFTTVDARMLGVRSRVASTDLPIPRSVDLGAVRRVAARLDGTLIQPDAMFSFLQRAGAHDVDGASVVASAAYAAAFEAGMSEFVRSPARVLTPGAAPGLDAAVAPGDDLRWRNGTPFGVYIRAVVSPAGRGPGEVHVQLWSTRFWAVTTQTTARYNVVEPTVQRLRGADCRPRQGQAGFEVDVQRTLVRHGREPRVETFHNRYAATGTVVCLRAGR